jgi:hypothetical protein
MLSNNKLFLLCLISTVSMSCHFGNKETKLKFEPLSNQFSSHDESYRKSISLWKSYYEHCTNKKLFQDAYYFQVQDKLYIGSINSEHKIALNGALTILDTSSNKNIFNLLSIVSVSNCYDTISLTAEIRRSFFNEVINAIDASHKFKSVKAAIDSRQMKIRIGTIGTIRLMTDSLIKVLNTTNDSSLIHFRELLLNPENVMLAETVEVLGFTAEFPLKMELSAEQEKQLAKEPFYDINASKEIESIKLLSNRMVSIKINKRYTVLGRFMQLKAGGE